MTEPTADPTLAKIKALTADRKRKRADREARQRAQLNAAIAKAQASNGEAPARRGGYRANSGRKRLFAESVNLTPWLDETTRHRLAAAGPGKAAGFLRDALARLVGDLAQDETLAATIAGEMAHLDPALWPVPAGHDRPKMAAALVTASAALSAQVRVFCGRGKLFASVSQMARVAVSRAIERAKGARGEMPK